MSVHAEKTPEDDESANVEEEVCVGAVLDEGEGGQYAGLMGFII